MVAVTTFAEIEVTAADFPLGTAVAADTGATLRLARVLPFEGRVVAYFWVPYADLVDVDEALRGSAIVESFGIVDTIGGEAQVRVERPRQESGLLETLWDAAGDLLEAAGDEQTWVLRARFDDDDGLAAFDRACSEAGILVAQDRSDAGRIEADLYEAGLTLVQRETLLDALELGYFDVPRRTTLAELAAETGVSDNAISQRLRRGMKTLVRATLGDGVDRDRLK